MKSSAAIAHYDEFLKPIYKMEFEDFVSNALVKLNEARDQCELDPITREEFLADWTIQKMQFFLQ
jgi:hypothetical protein